MPLARGRRPADWGPVPPRARAFGGLRYDVAVESMAPWHFLYFLPDPHGQGSLRPTLGVERRTVVGGPAVGECCASRRSPCRAGASALLSRTPTGGRRRASGGGG